MMTIERACRIALIASVVASIGGPMTPAVADTKIDVAQNTLGDPPAEFEFRRTGQGSLGQWAVVSDPSAVAHVVIEHVSRDRHEDRYPLAIYNPVSLKNVSVTIRFKIVAGTMQSAGVAVRLADERNYYAVTASALDNRVDLYRVLDGRMERITGIDADIFTDHWQALTVTAEGDQLTVALDAKPLFTAWDRTFASDGRVALWTEDDNVTRFDQIEITALPWSK
jgi:hypothetical protein